MKHGKLSFSSLPLDDLEDEHLLKDQYPPF